MKKLLILALISAPLFGFSQTKPTSTAGSPTAPTKDKEDPESKTLVYKPETIYADIVITSVPNRPPSIRMDFGRDVMSNLTDKEIISEITMLKQLPFPTVPDALNFLASKGWHQTTQYTVTTPNGTETRLVVEKKIAKRPGDPGASQRPATVEPTTKPADGTTKPTREAPPKK
jgi:hypothetical protein